MKKLFIAIALACMTATTASAFEVTGTATVSEQSQYVFRGVEQTNKAVTQGSLDFKADFVEFGLWASTLQRQEQFELDAYAGVTGNVVGIDMAAGIIGYVNMGANNRLPLSSEYYGKLGYDFDLVKAQLTAFYGIQTKDVWYEAEVSQDISIMTVTAGTTFGQYKHGPNKFETVYVGASANIYKGLAVNVDFSHALGNKMINGVRATNSVVVGIGYSF